MVSSNSEHELAKKKLKVTNFRTILRFRENFKVLNFENGLIFKA